jgi:hypothetical protein
VHTRTPLPQSPGHPGWGVNHLAAVAADGSAYILGGQHGILSRETTLPDVWRYDPGPTLGSGTYTRLAPLPAARSHFASSTLALSLGGDGGVTDILVLGGELSHRHGDGLAAVSDYDIAADRWSPSSGPGSLAPLPRPFDAGVAGALAAPRDGAPTIVGATGSYHADTFAQRLPLAVQQP